MAQPTEYHRGEMKVDEHLSMYHRFNSLVHWGSLALATGLTFFILLLCVHVGFLPSLIAAIVVLVAGTIWLRRPKAH